MACSERSTTTVRVGLAKSSESNLSLSDCLQKGPNLIPKVFDIHVHFCSYPIAVTTDIDKALLMIYSYYRDMVRFQTSLMQKVKSSTYGLHAWYLDC